MKVSEHLDRFMEQPQIYEYVDIYEKVLNGENDNWQSLFYSLINEITKDRKIFFTPDEQIREYGMIRDAIEESDDIHERNCLISVIFDALIIESIRTYSLSYDAPAILADEIHNEYLKTFFRD